MENYWLLVLSEFTCIFTIMYLCNLLLTKNTDNITSLIRVVVSSVILAFLSALIMAINKSTMYFSAIMCCLTFVFILLYYTDSFPKKLFIFFSAVFYVFLVTAFSHLIARFIELYYGPGTYLAWVVLAFKFFIMFLGLLIFEKIMVERTRKAISYSGMKDYIWIQTSIYPIIISFSTVIVYIPDLIYIQPDIDMIAMLFWITASAFLYYILSKYVITSAQNYEQNKELISINNLLNMQRQYYNTLSENLEKMRIFKHDFHHIIKVISALNEAGDMQQLTNYINEIDNMVISTDINKYCLNNTINIVISYYNTLAQSKGITLVTEFEVPNKFNKIDNLDISIVLCNLLENATRAVSEDNHPLQDKTIRIKCKYFNDKLIISVLNDFYGRIKKDESGKFLTTKNGEGGLGLTSVGVIATNNSGDIVTSFKDNCFSVYVTLMDSDNDNTVIEDEEDYM